MRFAPIACLLGIALQPALQSQEVIREQNVMMAARDGVKLATDVYHAAGTSRVPVLLHRTPYDKAAPATIAIAEFLRNTPTASSVRNGLSVNRVKPCPRR